MHHLTPAILLLQATLAITALLIGMDKFFHVMTDWQAYISSRLIQSLPVDPATFLIVAGITEIAIAALLMLRPLWGAGVFALWLTLFAISLITSEHIAFGVVVFALAASSVVLARLAAPSTRPLP